MPSYAYRATTPEESCERCVERFDVVQKLSEAPLERCPDCGHAVRRVIVRSENMTNRRWDSKKQLSDGNLKRLGFKKLVKESDGKYVDVLQD
ncbi:MAG: FmdB family zinc ribbon protein [Planctomycetota bacterium]